MSQPTEKRADELKIGDHIHDGRGIGPVEITHVQPHRNAHGDDRVLVVTDDAAVSWHPADELFTMATDAEVQDQEAWAHRQDFAAILERVAAMVADGTLPAPRYRMNAHWMIGNGSLVRSVAAALGLKVDEPTPDHHHVGFTLRLGDDAKVLVRVHAAEKPVEPGPEVEQPLPHYEARGWKGAGLNQGCGVECACGVSYDGFDSLAQAAALLSKHIKEGNEAVAKMLETPLDELPADFGADHNPDDCECEDCDPEVDVAIAAGAAYDPAAGVS